MGQHLIRHRNPWALAERAGCFRAVSRGGWIEPSLADGLKRMVGFRNIAVHDYQSLQLPITVSIIEKHLDEFLHYSRALLLRDGARPAARASNY